MLEPSLQLLHRGLERALRAAPPLLHLGKQRLQLRQCLLHLAAEAVAQVVGGVAVLQQAADVRLQALLWTRSERY